MADTFTPDPAVAACLGQVEPIAPKCTWAETFSPEGARAQVKDGPYDYLYVTPVDFLLPTDTAATLFLVADRIRKKRMKTTDWNKWTQLLSAELHALEALLLAWTAATVDDKPELLERIQSAKEYVVAAGEEKTLGLYLDRAQEKVDTWPVV